MKNIGDTMKTLLMAFGLLLALIGIYLTFKPRGDNARGELGGGLVKVETSGGIFLTLIGSAMMLLTSGIVTIGQPDRKVEYTPPTSTTSAVAPVPSSPSTASTASLPVGVIEFTAPRNGVRVSGRKGVILQGVAGPLGQDTLWLMTLADNGLYYASSDTPIAVRDGYWSFLDKPIGAGESDVGATFTILAVKADLRCRKTLENARPNKEGDIVFNRLPAGCVKADSVSVVKTSA